MRNNKNNDLDMHVIKRNGKKEIISFDKILKRIRSLGKQFNLQNIIYPLFGSFIFSINNSKIYSFAN